MSTSSPVIRNSSIQPDTLSESPLLPSAHLLLQERKVWKFVMDTTTAEEDSGAVTGFSARAQVFDGGRVPVGVEWDSLSGRYRCECGTRKEPCVHVTALLLKVAERRPDDSRFACLKNIHPAEESAAGTLQGDLFDWDIQDASPVRPKKKAASPSISQLESRVSETFDEPDPVFEGVQSKQLSDALPEDPSELLRADTDLLFFSEPSHVEKRAVTVLGKRDKVNSAWDRRRSANVTVTAAKEAAESEARFKDLRGGEWVIRPALSIVREDGGLGPPRPWSDDGLAEPLFPSSEEIRSTLAEYIGAGDDFLTPSGRQWTYRSAQALRFRFEPLLSANDDDPLYEPVAELLCAETGAFPKMAGAVVISGNGLLMLDTEAAVAAHLEDLGDSLWFVRLMLSRRVLSASDLKARLTGHRKPPKNILLSIPDLPDSLSVLSPSLVLEIHGNDGGTDLVPKWRYKTVIIDGKGRSDVVMDFSSGTPRPIGLRDKDAEDAAFDAAEDILGPALAWRRGRYSRLSGDPNVPMRLDSSLQSVLSEFGGALMDAGVELRLEDRPVRRGRDISIAASKSGSVLEMNAGIADEEGDIDALDLDDWLESGGLIRTESAYFTLTNKALEQLAYLRDHGMDDSGFLHSSPDNLSLIDTVYEEIEASEETAEELAKKREAYARLTTDGQESQLETPPPAPTFMAKLRPYQQRGYAWLHQLREEGLGGCLADDMGLGKTIQTLAYLSRLEYEGRLGPSLLVGPVVTLGNWEAEIQRFAPDLSFHRYAGAAGKRVLPNEDDGVHLVVVSYQTLRNDIERFLERDWDHVVLDEAHYVKNASSRTFKAVRSLSAAHRVSLTGTPLENRLDELWSQMSFLNPGLLGSRSHFTDRFVRPLEEGEAGEQSAGQRLSGIVAPFILRRKKSEVLHDLPPKDEAIIRCEMTDGQREAYEAMRSLYKRQVEGLLDGGSSTRIEIFTILSKLRLLAIHPPLAGERFAGIDSGKMAVMDNLLEEILEEDHKTLVFSQFLGALDRAEATCKSSGWTFSRLTGSTKDREEPIRRFNEDPDNRVFLLSLKAGGVGINLTAADYVMLLDPWWNPAVEAQAVDRAHRMGQKRPVMVYRLITTDTIEERVLDLQQRKKDLIADVLGDGDRPVLKDEEILGLFG